MLHPIYLDYPLHSTSRYGWGKPVHPQIYQLLNKNRLEYAHLLRSFLAYTEQYLAIPKYAHYGLNVPAWINGSLPGLDAVALYALMVLSHPKRYFEIGVGNSTKFVQRAIDDHHLHTRITGIDPYPMPGVEALCTTLIRKPLQEVELEIFDELEAGDILFVDSTHRVFMNSDVTIVFLDILPRLKPGVLVEFHDIALPLDYPPQWVEKYYSEQYLLAAALLAQGNTFEVILPNALISLDESLREIIMPLWRNARLNGEKEVDLLTKIHDDLSPTPQMQEIIDVHGSSFWIKMK